MSFLQINHLHKSFGNTKILDDINISVKEGDFFVLVGPPNSGKSTLLNIIAGLVPHESGDIIIGGNNVVGLDPSKRNIAMVLQSHELYPNMTVEENICFGMEMNGVPKSERHKKAMEVAKSLRLSNLMGRKPRQLFYPQKQSVAIGRAMARSPKLCLFDEPILNVGPKTRLRLRAEIKKLHLTTGTTMVYVTHDQVQAITLANRIAVMNQGIVQQIGTPREVYYSPRNTFVANFIGTPFIGLPAMNLFEGNLISKGGALQAVTKDAAGKDKVFTVSKPSAALKKNIGSKVIMGIRAENISISGGSARKQRQECLVDLVDWVGSETLVIFILGGVNVTAKLPGDLSIESQTKIPLFFDMDRVCFFEKNSGNRIN